MKRVLVLVLMVMAGLVGRAAPTEASPITYTETSFGSGTLGLNTFTNALITLTLTGDTSGVAPSAVYPSLLLNSGSATITIDGIGTATLNSPDGYAAVAAPFNLETGTPPAGFAIVQFDDATGVNFTHILAVSSIELTGYDLQTSIGPTTGAGLGLVDGSHYSYSTTLGLLQFVPDSGGDPVTMTATAVPEPSSLSLSFVSIGGLGLLAAWRQRRRQSA
jgi:PEP-CTERM motif